MQAIAELLGKTLSDVDVAPSADEILFACTDGSRYRMYHSQDCCESVSIEDVCGDVKDLLDSPITTAEESTSDCIDPAEAMRRAIFGTLNQSNDSETWTFYRLGTAKGLVTIRWYGTSNGYYSESVDFVRL